MPWRLIPRSHSGPYLPQILRSKHQVLYSGNYRLILLRLGQAGTQEDYDIGDPVFSYRLLLSRDKGNLMKRACQYKCYGRRMYRKSTLFRTHRGWGKECRYFRHPSPPMRTREGGIWFI